MLRFFKFFDKLTTNRTNQTNHHNSQIKSRVSSNRVKMNRLRLNRIRRDRMMKSLEIKYKYRKVSIIKWITKKIILIIISIIFASTYVYKKHMYEVEMLDQYNYLLQNNIKLSGVYIQQRQPFPILWYIQWLLHLWDRNLQSK
jgi:hypothetical protein